MLRSEYFLKAINGEAYRYKAWVLHCFSQVRLSDRDNFSYRLQKGDKHYWFNDPDTGEDVVLEDTDVSKPPFHIRHVIDLKAGDVVNLRENITTNYGRLLANIIALVYPLGDKIDYINEEFNLNAIETEIADRLTTDVKYQDKDSLKPNNPIYVTEYLNFMDAVLSMEGYSQLCVPSATAKTMTRDPRTPQLKKELLEKHKERLDDPAVIAQVEAELIAMDKAWIKGDLGEGFFHKSKAYDVVRKKAHLMHGYESGFGLKPDTIENSLSEGWEIDKLPAMVNSLREGSYGRGKMTAEGGYATKVANRMFQNVKLSRTDCGSTMGWEREVGESLKGFYYLNSSNKSILINPENFESLKGKTLRVRSPQFCQTAGNDFCQYCLGEPNSENENALSAHASALTSQLMSISMASAHGVALKTTTYQPPFTIV